MPSERHERNDVISRIISSLKEYVNRRITGLYKIQSEQKPKSKAFNVYQAMEE